MCAPISYTDFQNAMLQQVNLPRRAVDTNVPAYTDWTESGPIEDEIEVEIERQNQKTDGVRSTELLRRFPAIIKYAWPSSNLSDVYIALPESTVMYVMVK